MYVGVGYRPSISKNDWNNNRFYIINIREFLLQRLFKGMERFLWTKQLGQVGSAKSSPFSQRTAWGCIVVHIPEKIGRLLTQPMSFSYNMANGQNIRLYCAVEFMAGSSSILYLLFCLAYTIYFCSYYIIYHWLNNGLNLNNCWVFKLSVQLMYFPCTFQNGFSKDCNYPIYNSIK